MPAVAITDHGAMMGAVDFYEKAKKAGVKPIMGVEAYVSPGSRFDRGEASNFDDNETGPRNFHLILLAENEIGYRNLMKTVSAAHREGFYYKPRMDKELLRTYSEGLIASSACMMGEIPFVLMRQGESQAAEILEEYKTIFPGRFYLEIQDNGLPEQSRLNEALISLAKKTDTPLIATCDAHYLTREDAKLHEILLCLQTGKTMSDPKRMRFGTDQFYLKPASEFERAFGHVAPDALTNTLAIAERCNVKLTLGKNYIPDFKTPNGESSSEYLHALASKGLEKRFMEKEQHGECLDNSKILEYKERLRYELSVIDNMKYPGYFLIVWDFIRYAKENGIPVGPGRGSAAGSMVAYALGITEIDPIPYALLFERFLNPDRISLLPRNIGNVAGGFTPRRQTLFIFHGIRPAFPRSSSAGSRAFSAFPARSPLPRPSVFREDSASDARFVRLSLFLFLFSDSVGSLRSTPVDSKSVITFM